jgi:hypothetical protein
MPLGRKTQQSIAPALLIQFLDIQLMTAPDAVALPRVAACHFKMPIRLVLLALRRRQIVEKHLRCPVICFLASDAPGRRRVRQRCLVGADGQQQFPYDLAEIGHGPNMDRRGSWSRAAESIVRERHCAHRTTSPFLLHCTQLFGLSHQRQSRTLALRTTEEPLALSLKDVLPLFDAIEAVQLSALRYTIRKPHGMNLSRALKRVRRLQRELEKLRGALQSDLDALPR